MNIRKITLIISLLIHFLFLLFYKPLTSIQLFPTEELERNAKDQEKKIVFELVETPEDARSERPPENTNLVSDKNSIARDRYLKSDKPAGAPYSQGDLEYKELDNNVEKQPQPQTEENNLQQKEEEKTDERFSKYSYDTPRFSRQALLGKKKTQSSQRLNKPKYDNKKFSAREIGGLTFNTYEWNFAPYMLAMKRKVERNVFPPPAFTHMGLISGETIVQFKVMPNGEMKDLKVLQYIGHKTLMETSVQAIKSSAPFKPLPADFPEDYLVVTAKFSYSIRKY